MLENDGLSIWGGSLIYDGNLGFDDLVRLF